MMEMARRETTSGGLLQSSHGAHAPAGGVRRSLRMHFPDDPFGKIKPPSCSILPAARLDLEPPGPALERGKITQALIDIAALSFAVVFIGITAASFVVAIYVLLFVRTA